jgi:hypothetical protein
LVDPVEFYLSAMADSKCPDLKNELLEKCGLQKDDPVVEIIKNLFEDLLGQLENGKLSNFEVSMKRCLRELDYPQLKKGAQFGKQIITLEELLETDYKGKS